MATPLSIFCVLLVIINFAKAQNPNTFTIDDLPSNGKCGVQSTDEALGGEEVLLNEFPWMALLHYKKPDGREGFLCGASLIHENYVLTAAQCVRNPAIVRGGYVLDSVRLGEHDLRSDPDCQDGECADPVVNIPIAETIVHENYEPTSKSHANDIALIRLQRPAPSTEHVRPICLPVAESLRNKNYDGLPLEVAGFGRTENATRSEIKVKLGVNGFSLDQCTKIYERFSMNLGSKQLCAGGEAGKGTCNGDSGNALMATYGVDDTQYRYAVGIVSFGPVHCAAPGIPDVYTRVDQYMDWILNHMRK